MLRDNRGIDSYAMRYNEGQDLEQIQISNNLGILRGVKSEFFNNQLIYSESIWHI